jgi:drug/metabolite transporter (DMT)-like permease
MDKPLAVAALLLNATTWGLAWLPIRMLTDAGLHPLWATALIYCTATAAIALALGAGLQAVFRGSKGLWWLMLGSGLTNASFNWAVTLADVARVALLFYLMPVWAALLARWLLGEPLTWRVVSRIGLALTGAAIVFLDAQRSPGMGSWLADLLAITAGMTFAVNTVLLRKLAGQSRAAIALAMFGGGAMLPLLAALASTAAGYPLPMPAAPGPWVWLVVATAAAFVLGNLALQYGAARLPANTTALIMLTEVAVAAASGALLAGEALSVQVLAGGALIVVAAGLSILGPRGRAADKEQAAT